MIYGIAKWHENKDIQANPPSSKGVKNLGTTLSSLWCTEQYSKLTVGCWARWDQLTSWYQVYIFRLGICDGFVDCQVFVMASETIVKKTLLSLSIKLWPFMRVHLGVVLMKYSIYLPWLWMPLSEQHLHTSLVAANAETTKCKEIWWPVKYLNI